MKGWKIQKYDPVGKNFCDTRARRSDRLWTCLCSIPLGRFDDLEHATEIFLRSGLEIFGFLGWGFQCGESRAFFMPVTINCKTQVIIYRTPSLEHLFVPKSCVYTPTQIKSKIIIRLETYHSGGREYKWKDYHL